MRAKPKTKQNAKGNRSSTSGFTIGIDLGGTKVAAALVDARGKPVFETKKPTVPPSFHDSDLHNTENPSPADVKKHIAYVVNAMADAALECAEFLPAKQRSKNILGIGLASAGPMNISKGQIIDPANFKGWKTVPIVKLLTAACHKRGLKLKVTFQNDAIAAALGEGWTGVAKGKSTYVVLTIGTGIGTGVIFNGRPAQSLGMGSEWGHTLSNSPGFSKDKTKPNERDVEGIASGTGLLKQARLRGFNFSSTHEIADAAKAGDKNALELFAGASDALAGLMYTLSMGFNPDVFAVSGGMLNIRELYLPQAVDTYHQAMAATFPAFKKQVRVSKLGTKAGVIGAARLPRLEY